MVNSNQEEKEYISPVTQKPLSEQDIWSIENFTKEFLILKQNILAYSSTNNPSKNLIDDIEKDKVNYFLN